MSKQIDGHRPGRYELVPVGELIPYANNARTHSDGQIAKLQASIREFGFVNPVLIDGSKNIIAGHGRVEAAKREGISEVPCVFVEHLTDTQRKAYILADNRLAEDAGWDTDILKLELDALAELDFDITLTGFDVDDMSAPDVSDDDFDADAVADAIVEPVTKLGDIWTLGRHRLMCGDSTDRATVDRLMDGQKADMVFTDPPWNVNYGAVDENNAQGYKPRTIMNDSMSTEEFKDFLDKSFASMASSLKDGGMTYVVMSAQEWGSNMQALEEAGFHWSSTIIWNKDHLVMSRKDYHTKYEPIWYGWKEGAARLAPLEDRKQSDVWDFDRPTKSEEHPTMKPVALVERAVGNSSKRDNIVLDLFGGSGTTLIACEQLGRDCRMMELDPKYCDVIIKRWENLTGQTAVLNG